MRKFWIYRVRTRCIFTVHPKCPMSHGNVIHLRRPIIQPLTCSHWKLLHRTMRKSKSGRYTRFGNCFPTSAPTSSSSFYRLVENVCSVWFLYHFAVVWFEVVNAHFSVFGVAVRDGDRLSFMACFISSHERLIQGFYRLMESISCVGW